MTAMRTAFSDKALSVLTSEPFDGFRQSLRSSASRFLFTNMLNPTGAAFRFSKAAHDWLTTDEDRYNERQSDLKAFAERAIYETWYLSDPEEVRLSIQGIVAGKRGDFSVEEVQEFIANNLDSLLQHGYSQEQRAEMIAGVRAQQTGSPAFTFEA